MEKPMEQPMEKETTSSNKKTDNPFAPNKSFFFDALAKYKSEHQSDTDKNNNELWEVAKWKVTKFSLGIKNLVESHKDEIRAAFTLKQAA